MAMIEAASVRGRSGDNGKKPPPTPDS
jgi:hypothetical protein